MTEQEKRLYTEIARMRTTDPIEWAIVVGKRTVPRIAEHLLMAPKTVERKVEELIKMEVVKWGTYMGRPVLQVIEPGYKEMADFAYEFRRKLMGKVGK